MLPLPLIDDEMFEDILFNAKNMIKQVYPQWTNYNESDPGISFIELFSWFKEMQQYHMDNNDAAFSEKYLGILGIEKRKKQCASALIKVKNPDGDIFISERRRFYKENICFENTEPYWVFKNTVRILRNSRGDELVLNDDIMKERHNIRFTPFYKDENEKVYFEMIFSSPLPVNRCFGIYFKVYDRYPVKRNPIKDIKNFVPLAVIEAEIWYNDEWISTEIVSDETAGFLYKGIISVKSHVKMSECNGGYKLRFVLRKDNYDVYPVITKIRINIFKALQKETLCLMNTANYYESNITDIWSSYLSENGIADIFLCVDRENQKFIRALNVTKKDESESEVVRLSYDVPEGTGKIYNVRAVFHDKDFAQKYSPYTGNGYPYQKINLEDKDLMHNEFEIMIFDSCDGAFYPWKKVNDFDLSQPESRHYIFNEQSGEIIFGDCENGLAPDGEVVIISASRSCAENGNIKAGSITGGNRFLKNISLRITDANGGSRAETVSECFTRFIDESHDKSRCVNYADYQKEIYSVQGLMIENCSVSSTFRSEPSRMNENSITAVVQPYSENGNAGISDAYIKNIEWVLNKKRLIGTDIKIVLPVYVGIEVYADVVCGQNYTDAGHDIENRIKEFFEKIKTVFGKKLEYNKLYFLTDTLPFVRSIKSFTISCSGRGAKICDNGDIQLAPDALAYLKKIVCTFTNEK